MRVLFYALTGNHGGIEVFIHNYFTRMKGIQIDFVAMDPKVIYEEEFEKLGSKIYHMPNKRQNRAEFYKSLEQIFQTQQYDVAWFNDNNLCDITFLKIAKKYGVKTRICHSHSTAMNSDILHLIKHKMNRHVVQKYANVLWACSEAAKSWAYEPKYAAQSRFIPNAIEVEKYLYDEEKRKQVRKELGVEGKYVIGHVGRMSEIKNQMFLLEAFVKVVQERPDSMLILVGKGELLEQVRARVKELNLEEHVLVLGARTDVYLLEQAFDLFVLPSLFEGMPVVAIEAQAAGVPCIISDHVPGEAKETEAVSVVALDAGVDGWSKAMIQGITCDRKSISDQIYHSCFNINTEAQHLQDLFYQM